MFCTSVACMYKNMPDFNRRLQPRHCMYRTVDRVYVFSNENISDYLDQLGDMRGKRVLSVCASGDHAFECYARGASRVDTFDINYVQKNMMELKLHMIRNLPYEAFVEYFFGFSDRFSPKIIAPLWNEFSESLKIFYSQIACSDVKYGMSPMVSAAIVGPGRNVGKISYIQDPSVYDKLAQVLPEKINFKHIDLESLAATTTAKYDIVLMSNIFDYMYGHLHNNEWALNKLYDSVLSPLAKNNLNNDGTIVFDYMWGRRAIDRIHLLEDFFSWANTFNARHKDEKMGYLTFDASWGKQHDCVLTMNLKSR